MFLKMEKELTFNDVFIIQNYFKWWSRNKVNIKPNTQLNTNIPIISANMNAVSWKRMSINLARLWWLSILPQDMSHEKMIEIVKEIKNSNIYFDKPIIINNYQYVKDALSIILKKSHKTIIIVDKENKFIWWISFDNLKKHNPFTLIKDIDYEKYPTLIIDDNWKNDILASFAVLESTKSKYLIYVNKNKEVIWITSKEELIRQDIYKPTLDKNWKLDVGIAIWINQINDNKIEEIKELINMWISTFVLDTAHWFQLKMKEWLKILRDNFWKSITIIAWNVCTWDWTKFLIENWADWVKVWIGPWAMCTTRIMTWVWRPQFSAIMDCAKVAKELWWFVWWDWWIKNPRDLSLALAAWATHIMLWTILSWTFESVAEIKEDNEGKLYKENYWMASGKAVEERNLSQTNDLQELFNIEKKKLYQEWISTSKIYLKHWYDSVWKIIDKFTTWLKSAMTYVWVDNIDDFYKNVTIWIQTQSWFIEWTPHWEIIK